MSSPSCILRTTLTRLPIAPIAIVIVGMLSFVWVVVPLGVTASRTIFVTIVLSILAHIGPKAPVCLKLSV